MDGFASLVERSSQRTGLKPEQISFGFPLFINLHCISRYPETDPANRLCRVVMEADFRCDARQRQETPAQVPASR
jgi:hypothetical protein